MMLEPSRFTKSIEFGAKMSAQESEIKRLERVYGLMAEEVTEPMFWAGQLAIAAHAVTTSTLFSLSANILWLETVRVRYINSQLKHEN